MPLISYHKTLNLALPWAPGFTHNSTGSGTEQTNSKLWWKRVQFSPECSLWFKKEMTVNSYFEFLKYLPGFCSELASKDSPDALPKGQVSRSLEPFQVSRFYFWEKSLS